VLNQISVTLNKREGIKCKIINLNDNKIEMCRGCEMCLTKDFCPIRDDFNEVLEDIKSADGIIIGTPVYLRNISSLLKKFCDRACKWYHRSEIVGMTILGVITTAFSGVKQTDGYLKDLSLQWGAVYSGAIVRNAINIDMSVKEKELKQFIDRLYKEKKDYKPSISQLIEFQTQRILAKKILTTDKRYWIEKGWLDKPYFYECKINIFKLAISKAFSMILDKVIPEKNL
jgi:multimeric flavodoxin WrbA